MATAPKPGASRDAPTMSVTVNGTHYTVRLTELTALDDASMRKATGFTVASLMQAAGPNPGLDAVAVLVWLARRQAGERDLTFDEVAGELSYADDVDFVDSEGDDAPEASGAG